MSGDKTFLMARLMRTRELIVAYENAVTSLLTDGIQSYTLNTSQSTQTVTKFDLNNLNMTIDALYNRCATIEARLGMNNTTLGVPAW